MLKGKELQAIVSIAGKVDPSLQKSLKQASGQFGGIKKAAKIAGAAAAAGMAAAAAVTVKAVQAAAEYEKSFAKTATLLKGTPKELQEYSDAIVQLSNETGTATTELTETVYNAISAGVDQSDAVEFAGQAAKLAAGGFTDSATAVDVMTTALNAYGLQAESAGKISDYLITTQNLGKTTVNELASSVGKVIPIASAYGVEMDNLSTAYAQLTAGGIATAEAGTYLKSMLNELGDSGSVVSKTLIEQTGQSFAELTGSGKSLGDIMDILGESVGGEAGAFNELWSSSEAGVGALSLLNGGAEAYNQTLEAMQNSTGATDQAYGTMTDTMEHQLAVIKNLGTNFLADMGKEALPVIKGLAEDAIPVLTGGMKQVLPMFQGMAKTIAQFLPMLVDIGEIGMPLIETSMQMLFGILSQLMPVFQEIINAILPVIQQLIQTLVPVIQMVFEAMTPIIGLVTQLISQLLPPLMTIIQALMPVFTVVANIVGTTLVGAFQMLMPVISAIIAAVTTIANVFAIVFEGIVGIVAKPINAIIGLVNKAIGAINDISVEVPDWVPVIGGQHFGFSIPEIPMLATGGFTSGVSIAGEEGPEAVISFDPAYRQQNLSYWAKAGQMLGATDGDFVTGIEDAAGNSIQTTEYNLGGVTFAPQITIQGSAQKQDVLEAIRAAEPEFFDMLEDFMERKGRDAYAAAY